ncbi:MAG: flagellar biosynthesis protein FlhF [Clostridiales bacterium]|nr:flagellar biosynthesis protein FlhF [Clostridiales bacterium]
MIIKKFQAKTENDAVEAAKKELGPDVVVMSVRKVKPKGLFKFLKHQLTEVTVAMEEESEKAAKRERAAAAAAAVVQSAVKTVAAQATETIKEDQKEKMADNPPVRNLGEEKTEGKKKEEAEKMLEERLNNLQSFLEKQLMNPEEEKEDENIEEEENESVKFMQLLYNTMIENEVDETYANEMIDEIEKIKKENMPIDYALAHVYQKLILKFGKPAGISPAKQGTKVCFFVGPTGVGKTTTIAKIASRFTVDEKKKVALLTADTYRIAAAEQLRTYAGILEVPFRVIYSAEDLEDSVKEFKDYDYILVDTAGHSHHNEEQKENMSKLIHGVDESAEKEVFLVVSATTKYRDLISIADAYKAMTEYKLIFTKLDETTTLGNLLNLKLYTGASLSYVTCGQNVPDDIENFNPQTTVKQLLGGKK